MNSMHTPFTVIGRGRFDRYPLSYIATVTDAIAAGSPLRRREFSAVAGCFLLETRTKQFIFLYPCVID